MKLQWWNQRSKLLSSFWFNYFFNVLVNFSLQIWESSFLVFAFNILFNFLQIPLPGWILLTLYFWVFRFLFFFNFLTLILSLSWFLIDNNRIFLFYNRWYRFNLLNYHRFPILWALTDIFFIWAILKSSNSWGFDRSSYYKVTKPSLLVLLRNRQKALNLWLLWLWISSVSQEEFTIIAQLPIRIVFHSKSLLFPDLLLLLLALPLLFLLSIPLSRSYSH